MSRPQGARPDLSSFGEVLWPDEAIEPILARPVRSALTEWLTELWAEDELTAVGVAPRRRALFDGAPGVGKTTLAHHLAARIGLPMIAVRPDRLIDSWVGSTGRNIGALFDAAAAGMVLDGRSDPSPVILFLDEIDAVASPRREARQAADDARNEWVNTLLQRIEGHRGFLIGATNFGSQIDPAVWRRFDIHITLELPGQNERERILARYLEPYGLGREPLASLADAFATASPALIRSFCENLKRQLVVGPKLGADMRREAVIDRIVATVSPHPTLGKPRLWSKGSEDRAIQQLPWPLPLAEHADTVGLGEGVADEARRVVPLPRRTA